MPGYGAAFGRGLILGVGAALLYAAARETIAPARRPAADTSPDQNKAQSDDRSRLIDWNLATQVAIRAAGRTPTLHPGARTQLQAQYEAMLRDIERPISRYVGNDLSLANTKVEVLDRPGWIRANMVNFRYLLQPVEDFYRENAMRSSFGPPLVFQHAARVMLSSQVGVLVGYLARRGPGQSGIALPGAPAANGGQLYFVRPNMQQDEERLPAAPRQRR